MGLAGAVSVCTNLQYRARSDAVGAIIVARGTMRVAIYARVSTGEQNPELQLRELRDYAERRGFIFTVNTWRRSPATCGVASGRRSSRP